MPKLLKGRSKAYRLSTYITKIFLVIVTNQYESLALSLVSPTIFKNTYEMQRIAVCSHTSTALHRAKCTSDPSTAHIQK